MSFATACLFCLGWWGRRAVILQRVVAYYVELCLGQMKAMYDINRMGMER